MTTKSRWTRRLWLVGVVVLAVSAAGSVLLLGGAANSGNTNADSSSSTDSETEQGLVCLGHVDVEGGVSRLSIAQSGRIKDILVKEGQPVADREPLIQLDDAYQQSQLAQAKEALSIEQAKKEQAQLQIAMRQKELELQQLAVKAAEDRVTTAQQRLKEGRDNLPPGRVKEMEDALRDQEALQRIERGKIDVIQLSIQAAEKDLKQAGFAVTAKEEQVKQAEKAVADCILKAPAPGKVLRLRARPGELVGPTFPEPLIEFCPDKPRIIRAEVHQEFAGRVRLEAECRIVDDVESGAAQWKGKVSRISDWYSHRRSMLLEPLQLNDVRTLECIITLEPNQPPLRIGQRVRVMMGNVWR